ncbi:ABC transporter substrate-binding protein [Lapidilactobacillus mulanensis]|uniref:ABC transporter substrate-binding protein n=1 Tax=Lapidilactobacillus mulanensis TaxID=2485999 RepID=A0ABW4DKE6_9LACO|nr:ABC transporter substrate-binding protein [Lapidilactobacillus mulanensis]
MKKNFGKKIGLVLLTALTTIGLAACGNGGSSSSNKTADGKTKMTMWTFVDAQGTFFKNAAKSWNKTHKQKIDLTVNVLPFDQMNQKLTVALQSGSGAPDIADVELGQGAIQLKADKPAYYPLNSALKPYMNNLVKSRLDNFKKNGNYYGLDYHVGTTVTYYNTDIMKAAGVDYTKIKTWDDYEKAGEQVKAKTGKWMNEVEYSAMFQYDAMVTQQHADYIKNDKATLTNAANVRVLTQLQNWIYKDKIARTAVGGSIDNDQFFAEMNKGNVASVTMPSWYMERIADHMPKLKGKIAIAPMPVFNEGDYRSAGGGGTGTMVTNQASNKKLAAKFVVWAKASKGQAVKIWEDLGFDPVRSDIWSEPVMKEDNKYTRYFGKDIFDTFVQLKSQVTSTTKTAKISPDLNDYMLKNTFPSTLLKDKMTPKAALQKANDALNK